MKRNTISKDSKRVDIYCRVSTDDQSCDRQERDLTAFAKRAGYHVVGVYKETASGTKNNRQERACIIERARGRNIDAVLVTELTRWGRSTVDLLETLKELNEYGVSVIAQTGAQFDLGTAQGKMIAGVLAVLAEFERDLLSERTKSGMAAAIARGRKLGRPAGNRTDAKHRAKVLSLRKQGLSYREIASSLRIGTETVGRLLNS
ncbi:MAG: recombinase family protein [Patescibacteria group bacterium]|nr:recombinase family protein [Patescibacteria group bacterium]